MEPRQPKTSGAFDEDLEAVRSAWSDLPREAPPELIDQAVLNLARRQISASSRGRTYRWMGALATAAVVVLAVNLVVQQEPRAPTAPPAPTDGFRLDGAESRPAVPGPRSEVTAETAQSPGDREVNGQAPSLREAAPAMAQPARGLSDTPAEEQSLAVEPVEQSEHERLGADEPPEPQASVQTPAEVLPMQKASRALPRPDDWIGRLLELKEAGEEQALLQELAEFRDAYPDYPLPPELAGL